MATPPTSETAANKCPFCGSHDYKTRFLGPSRGAGGIVLLLFAVGTVVYERGIIQYLGAGVLGLAALMACTSKKYRCKQCRKSYNAPKTTRMADAALKKAVAAERRAEYTVARDLYCSVVAAYPGTPAADDAESAIRALESEGKVTKRET
jgi:hypothetical protein